VAKPVFVDIQIVSNGGKVPGVIIFMVSLLRKIFYIRY